MSNESGCDVQSLSKPHFHIVLVVVLVLVLGRKEIEDDDEDEHEHDRNSIRRVRHFGANSYVLMQCRGWLIFGNED